MVSQKKLFLDHKNVSGNSLADIHNQIKKLECSLNQMSIWRDKRYAYYHHFNDLFNLNFWFLSI